MMSEIQAGDGWRLIDKAKDTPQRGDQFHDRQVGWQFRPNWPLPFDPKLTYRRRIPTKPEAMEIGDRTFKCNSFDEVITRDDIGDRRKLVSSPEQARQLADWLTRYAEWREAQESK
jgi:hypothetical protein